MDDADPESTNPDRRDFLEIATAGGMAGAAVVGLTSCFGVLGHGQGRRPLDEHALGARLEQLEEGLESLSTRRFVSEVILGVESDTTLDGDVPRNFFDRADALTRRALRALMFLSMYIDLPEETREHPSVQAWVERFSPELEEALAESALLLSRYPPDEIADVEGALREDTALVMRICEAMDGRGRARGVGRPSRRLLRAVGRRLTNVLRERPLREVIDECLSAFSEMLEENDVDVTTVFERNSELLSGLWPDEHTAPTATAKELENAPVEGANEPEAEAPTTEGSEATTAPAPASNPTLEDPPVAEPARPPGCVERVGSSYAISGRCPEAAPPPSREETPRRRLTPREEYQARMDEYHQWRRSRPRRQFSYHRYRVGRGLTIAGAVLLLGCGVGIFILIPGVVLLAISGHRRRRQ